MDIDNISLNPIDIVEDIIHQKKWNLVERQTMN